MSQTTSASSSSTQAGLLGEQITQDFSGLWGFVSKGEKGTVLQSSAKEYTHATALICQRYPFVSSLSCTVRIIRFLMDDMF